MYRLAPPDRTGWFLGLGGSQVVPLAAGIGMAALLLAATSSLPLALAPLATGTIVAFTRVGGVPLLELAPVMIPWFVDGRDSRRFDAPVPLRAPLPVMPAAFGGCEIVTLEGLGGELAVVIDRRRQLAAGTLRLSARSPFLLADASEQDRMLAAFGGALSPLCREGASIVSLRWSSFAAPTGRPWREQPMGPASCAYDEVLDLIAPTPQHEVLCTLTVRHDARDGSRSLARDLAEPLELLATRLADTGFVSEPLAEDSLGFALRRRLDPAGRGAPGTLATLARAAGFLPMAAAGPLSAEERLTEVQVDSTIHRAYHLVEWPRAGVHPAWMADLLLALPVTRIVCVVFEPIAPRVSRRAIGRAAAKLDSDEEQRQRAGFRIGAGHEATRAALAERESELVAGHGEFDYAGLILLSAPDRDTLVAHEEQARSAAAAAGVELAPMHARHAGFLGVCLPLARTLPRRLR
jgi:hypothetical protein